MHLMGRQRVEKCVRGTNNPHLEMFTAGGDD